MCVQGKYDPKKCADGYDVGTSEQKQGEGLVHSIVLLYS